jgi:adenine-specific DNA methylase
VDAPKDEEERQRLHGLIRDIIEWDATEPGTPLNMRLAEAARLVGEAHQRRTGKLTPPRVLDPFSGGGSIPLEAARLGCQTLAADLNPVAYLLGVAGLYLPQKHARTRSQKKATSGQLSLDEIVCASETKLSHDIRTWGTLVQSRVRANCSKLYPSSPGREILAYFWAKTVRCSNPACRVRIPVIAQSWLTRQDARPIAFDVEMDASDPRGWVTPIREGEAITFDPSEGTYSGGKLTCPACKQITPSRYIREEGVAGRIGEELLVVCEVSNSEQGRTYGQATKEDAEAVQAAVEMAQAVPAMEEVIPTKRPSSNARGLSAVVRYGFDTFGKLYNPRQFVVLNEYACAIESARAKMLNDGEDEDYANAVALYLAFALNRIANQCTRLCRWYTQGEKIQGAFSKQAIAMVWDYVESNPTGDKAASWTGAMDLVAAVAEHNSFQNPVAVHLGSATDLSWIMEPLDPVITDPPYYDSVPYADLSDFFFVWLKRSVGQAFPGELAGALTPKRREIVQQDSRHGGAAKAREFYETEMAKAFGAMRAACGEHALVVIVFAHKTTAAWETLLKALLDSDLVVTASWPIDTEMRTRTAAQGAASLASSVFIVCRPRTADDAGFLDDVEPELKSTLSQRLDHFWSQGIRGADFFMSAIGPAVEVFGRHKRVLKLSGEEVTIAELLDRVRGIVADYALQRIVHGEAAGDVDEASRFYVIWRWAFGTTEVDSGEAIHMAQSMGCEFNELVADRGVLHKKGDKVNLKGPLDRKKIKGLGDPAATGTLAPLIDVLHRAANLWAAGERQELADFLGAALPAGGADHMQRLAQSIVDVLPPGDKERALYENFLVGSRSLPAPTQPVETADPQMKLF